MSVDAKLEKVFREVLGEDDLQLGDDLTPATS